MATTHEGVEGGKLFSGMKFHLVQRIPTRNTWKDLITSNGGKTVLVEAQADIVIADHAYRGAPPGSISWTYIEQSVRKGALEDIEDHRAGPATHIVRDVASGQPTRKGRVPFTPEDDRMLMEWCTRAERKGLSLKGNEIYKQLEEQNSRHTFQSWRDRWIKNVSLKTRPQLSDTEDDGDLEEDHGDEEPHAGSTRNDTRPPSSRPHAARADGATKPVLSSSRALTRPRARQSPTTSVEASNLSDVFTDEETQLLLNEYNDIINLDEDRVIDAWIAWASANPSHTAQQWRNYFKEFVAPQKRAEAESKVQTKTFPPPPRSSSKASANVITSKQVGRQLIEIKDSQESSGHNLSSPDAQRKGNASELDEVSFKEALKVLADSLGFEVDFNPTICGRTVSLFEIFRVVNLPEFGGFDAVTGTTMWNKVASKLNFNPFRSADAAQDLKQCYSEYLADFEDYKRELDLGASEADTQLIEDQLRVTATHDSPLEAEVESEDDDDDLNAHSTRRTQPVVSSSSKRSFEMHRSHSSLSYNKRQRIDKGKGKELEIPSTPEDVINYNQMPRPSHKPSPLGFPSVSRPSASISEYEDLPVRPLDFHRRDPQPHNLEPETQDFHYSREGFADGGSQHISETSEVWSSSSAARRKDADRRSASNTATRGSNTRKDDSSTQSQTQSQTATKLAAYLKEHVDDGLPQEIVIEALESTTLDLGEITNTVMDSLLDGKGIPEDIPGIWTTWDDDALDLPADSNEYKRIVRKHGTYRVRNRKKYVTDRREVQQTNAAGVSFVFSLIALDAAPPVIRTFANTL